LPVGDVGEAYAVADRVRRKFADAAVRFTDGDLAPTVSAGVTIGMNLPPASVKYTQGDADDAKAGIDTMLDIADRALYRAKANGRNRVEAIASLNEKAAPFACAPSIVPLIKTERVTSAPMPGWPRRASH
jgi:PleD family two-component response regulator